MKYDAPACCLHDKFANGLRAIGALMVCYYHFYQDLEGPLQPIVGCGDNLGVATFFALLGYSLLRLGLAYTTQVSPDVQPHYPFSKAAPARPQPASAGLGTSK